MKCAVHPEVDVSGFCRNCGKPMCPACVRPVRDVLYCEDCLAQVIGIPAAQPVSGQPVTALGTQLQRFPSVPPGRGRPATLAVAFLLGLYRDWERFTTANTIRPSFTLCIFAGIIVGITGAFGDNLVGFCDLALICFVFYMAIDAVRSAKARETGQPVTALSRIGPETVPWGPSF